jgi:aminoglycoside 6'-N-acetyltransferase I
MTRVNLRPASPNDIPALGKLYHAFHEFHAAVVSERLHSLGSWEEFDASQLAHSLQGILNNHKACLIVAEDNGTLVGFIEVYMREDEPDPARISYVYGHLQSLMVTSGWRGQGLGKRLIAAAETWAVQNGASEMRLDTWEFPGDSLSFYEQIGYRTVKRKLVRRL